MRTPRPTKSPIACARLRRPLLAACAVLLTTALAPGAALGAAGDEKRVCAYSDHSIAALQAFGRMVHRDMDCAVIYGASTDWSSWESPWFVRHQAPDSDWSHWATAPGTSRRLIITEDLIPAALNGGAWRAPGAAGAYDAHARALAHNLIAAGLGAATIRLAPESNGDWYPDSIGNTPTEFAQWVQFWRHTVLAMRSVPGAHFLFDWCIHAPYRPIPPARFYPGDDVVDIIGVDSYDLGIAAPAGPARWSLLYNRLGSIGTVVAFAKARGKPLSIPEWGLSATSVSQGGGDDPAYVNGIADVVRSNHTSYQAYFYKYSWASTLAHGPLSLAAYISHFGRGGDTVPGTPTPLPRTVGSGLSTGKHGKLSKRALAQLRRRVKAMASAAMSALVRHGKGSKLMIHTRLPVGAVACLVAYVDPNTGARPAAATRRANVARQCGTRRFAVAAAHSAVLAAGSGSLSAGTKSGVVVRLHPRAARRLRSGAHVRLTVVAVLVPRNAQAVASVKLRRVRTR